MKFVSPQLPNGGVFDVMAYGAKGDGTTDDSTAIGLCLAAAGTYAASNGGAVVNFPPAKYKWTSVKEVKSDVTIMAYGAYIFGNSTAGFIKNYNTTPAAGYTTGNQRISILGGTWDGKGQSAASGADYILVDLRNARGMTIRDATFRNVSSLNAIRLLAIDGASVQMCRFEGYKDNSVGGESARGEMICLGLDGSGNCTKNVAIMQNASGPATDGSALTAAFCFVGSHEDTASSSYTGIRVIGNQVEGNGLDTGEGILATGWSDSVISDNVLTAIGWHGIMAISVNRTVMERVIISGNTILDNKYKGVTVEPASGTTATGFNINNNIVSNSEVGPGIAAWRLTSSAIIGNHVSGGTDRGLRFVSSNDVLVANNNVNSPDLAGITLDGCTRFSVTGNRVYDTGQHGIYLQGGSSRNSIAGNQVGGYSRSASTTYSGLAMDNSSNQADNAFIGNRVTATGTSANIGNKSFVKEGGSSNNGGNVVVFNAFEGNTSGGTHSNNVSVTGTAVTYSIAATTTANNCLA